MRYDKNDAKLAKKILDSYVESCNSDKIITLTEIIKEKESIKILATFIIQYEGQACRIDVKSAEKTYHLSTKTTKKIGELIEYIPMLKWITTED